MKDLLRRTWKEFRENDAMTHSAALAFYGLLSLIPFLSLILLIIGFFLHGDTATDYILGFVKDFIGKDVADMLARLFQRSESYASRATSTVGLAVLLIGATALVGHLQKGLNQMFDVEPPDLDTREKVRAFFKKKGKFLVTVLAVAIMIIGSLGASFLLNALIRALGMPSIVYNLLNYPMVFVIAYFFIAFLFMLVPDKRITFRQIRLGTLVATLLLILGQVFIGLFFRYSDKARLYGFLTGIILFVLWLYYSAIVFYLGAEFTACVCGTADTTQDSPGMPT